METILIYALSSLVVAFIVLTVCITIAWRKAEKHVEDHHFDLDRTANGLLLLVNEMLDRAGYEPNPFLSKLLVGAAVNQDLGLVKQVLDESA